MDAYLPSVFSFGWGPLRKSMFVCERSRSVWWCSENPEPSFFGKRTGHATYLSDRRHPHKTRLNKQSNCCFVILFCSKLLVWIVPLAVSGDERCARLISSGLLRLGPRNPAMILDKELLKLQASTYEALEEDREDRL